MNLVSPPSPSQQKQPEKLAPAEVMSVKHVKQGDVKAKDRVQGKVRFQAKEGVVPHNYVTVVNTIYVYTNDYMIKLVSLLLLKLTCSCVVQFDIIMYESLIFTTT